MKNKILLFLCLAFQQLLLAQSLSLEPQNLSAELSYGTTEMQTLTITNNTDSIITVEMQGVKTKILSLTNGVDFDWEYPRTINAITAAYDNYELTEINVSNSFSSLLNFENALSQNDALLIAQQEVCGWNVFSNIAPILHDFVQNGGTIIFTGTSISSNEAGLILGRCIEYTGLFANVYSFPVPSDTALSVNLPNNFLVAGVNGTYQMEDVTYAHGLIDEDLVRLVEHNHHAVVSYRNIGEGKVILIGHSYLEKNVDMIRILANAVKSGGGIEWLNLNVFETTLAAGESTMIDLTFDAATTLGTLYGGLYEANLIVNDGLNEYLVPLNLTVLGLAEFSLIEDNLDFGETFTTDIATEILQIQNTGTDSLFITNIESDNPYFNVAQTEWALYGGHFLDLEVFYSPLTTTNDSGNLYIYTNISPMPFVISLTGQGINSPIISPTPDSIELTLNLGEEATETIIIENVGLENLDFTLHTGQTSAMKNVLMYGFESFWSDWYFDDFRTVIEQVPNVNLTEENTTDLATMEILLQQHNILLLLGNNSGVFYSNPTLIDDFIAAGGHVVFLGVDLLPLAISLGLFEGTVGYNWLGTLVEIEPHPMTQNVVTGSFFDIDGIHFQNDVQVLLEYNQYYTKLPILALNEQNRGKAVFITPVASYIFEPTLQMMLKNTIQFLSDNISPTWLSFENENSSFSNVGFPDQSVSFDLHFDTDGMAVGTYFSEIILENNSITPNVNIPVTLHITGGMPQILVETTNLDFGELMVGDTIWQSIRIDNPGTDTLFISNVLGGDSYAVSETEIVIPPFGHQDIHIAFFPSETINYEATLTLFNNVGDININLSGIGIAAPSIVLLPDTLFVNVFEPTEHGTTSSFDTTFIVQNEGLETLIFDVLPSNAFSTDVATNSIGANSSEIVNFHLTTTYWQTGDYEIILPITSNDPLNDTINFHLMLHFERYSPALLDANITITQEENCDKIVSFNNSVNNAIPIETVSWLWSFGDGTTSAEMNPTHNYETIGTYSVFLQVCSGGFCATAAETLIVTTDFAWCKDFISETACSKTWDETEELNFWPYPINTTLTIAPEDAGLIKLNFSHCNLQQQDSIFIYDSDLADLSTLIEVFSGSNLPNAGEFINAYSGTMTIVFDINYLDEIYNLGFSWECEKKPAANFNMPLYQCENELSFYDESEYSPNSWFWDFGDGSFSVEQNPIHLYENDDEYTVFLQACNDFGCDFSSQNIIITDNVLLCEGTSMIAEGTQNITMCSGTLLDTGQIEDYLPNVYAVTTIAPPNATSVSISFSEFDIATSDYLAIYNGATTNNAILGIFSGNNLPNDSNPIVAQSGKMTIAMYSNDINNGTGFIATWECTTPNTVLVQAKAYLEGAFDGTNMNTDLLDTGILPNEQPYDTQPWSYEGNETTIDFPEKTTDWVLLEARDAENISEIVETHAALLLNNGNIVDASGNENGVLFYNLIANENYYFVIRHRNHLDVVSQNAILVPNENPLDFSKPEQVMQSSTQLKDAGNNNYVLLAGDIDGNGVFTVADFNIYANELGSINHYVSSDCNLNKTIETGDFNLYRPNMSRSGLSIVRY